MTTTNSYENPQYPFTNSEIFQPDQLIAGVFPIVTDGEAIIEGNAVLARGTVMGQVTLPSATVTAGTNTGNGTCTGVSLDVGADLGTYTLTATGADTFNVTAPNGDPLSPATVGVAYNDQIAFTLTAGATAFVAGDKFTITGEQASGAYKVSVATASDGSQTPRAILADQVDTTAGNANGGVYLSGEFNARAITFDASWTQATLKAALRTSSIFLKGSVSALPPTYTE